jgi:hypothetical protein
MPFPLAEDSYPASMAELPVGRGIRGVSCPSINSLSDAKPAALIGCTCNTAGAAISKGFMDNSAGIS